MSGVAPHGRAGRVEAQQLRVSSRAAIAMSTQALGRIGRWGGVAARFVNAGRHSSQGCSRPDAATVQMHAYAHNPVGVGRTLDGVSHLPDARSISRPSA